MTKVFNGNTFFKNWRKNAPKIQRMNNVIFCNSVKGTSIVIDIVHLAIISNLNIYIYIHCNL